MTALANLELHAVEAAVAAGSAVALVEAAAARDPANAVALRRVASALRRDAALLRTRPELTLSCVVRTCGTDPEVAPMLERWADAWRAANRGAWLRALVPPVLPLSAPVIAEFVDDGADGNAALWCTAAGDRVGTGRAEDRRGWDVASGARLTAADLADVADAPPASRFALAHDGTWGAAACVDAITGDRHDVVVDGDSQFVALTAIDDHDVLVGGWWGDYDGVLARVHPPSGGVRWRIELPEAVTSVAVARGAPRAFVHAGRHGYVVRTDDGEVEGSTPLVDAAGALSADGRWLVTRGAGALRLWDVEGLLDDQTRARRRGLVDASFDRDGAVLLRGQDLCDARTGTHLATLDVDGGTYLEGGPPERGRRVLPTGFIEVGPAGLKRWDLGGAEVPTGYLRLMNTDEAAFCDDGELLAARRQRDEFLAIHRTDTARVVARSESPAEPTFGWAPHAHALAYVASTGDLRLLEEIADGCWRDRRVDTLEAAAPRLVWSVDGRRLAIVSRDRAQIWACGGPPRLLGAVELPAAQPQDHAEMLHGQHGFVARHHPYRSRWRAGLAQVEDALTGAVIAVARSDAPLTADPSGTRWASRDGLFALEMPAAAGSSEPEAMPAS
ncbi:MAG: hypothetical protein R3B06_05895 [Kofleriaceae bacterium]